MVYILTIIQRQRVLQLNGNKTEGKKATINS